ncbi:MAG: CxxxxCH/CxxCH domain-containing protein, partial [Thermodesulfovibrionales bacterium]
MKREGLQLYVLPFRGSFLILICIIIGILYVSSLAWSDDPIIHNSNRFGTCSDPAYNGTSQADCEGVGGTWTPKSKWSGKWGTDEAGSEYGKFVCETCHEFSALNIKSIKSIITAPNSPVNDFSGSSVIFQSTKDGSSDFGDDTACSDPVYTNQTDCENNGGIWTPRMTSDRVCEVCHSVTLYHRYDTTGQTVFNHKNASDCTFCHAHNKGFKPENCELCHGTPPIDSSSGGPTGLANSEGGTGSLTSGAHERHATNAELGYSCRTCHINGMPISAIYDKNVQIGFNIFNAYPGGTYDGRTLPLANGYGYEAGNPQTTITNAGLMECSGIYCHGATMDPNGGTDITPVWDDPTTAQCGTCHGASASSYPTRGGHMKHARAFLDGYSYDCGLCHKDPVADDSLHVNNRSEVVFSSDPKTSGGTYGGTATMLDTYGTCTNVYCHSSVQSSPPGSGPTYKTTYAWGEPISLGCGSCHGFYDGFSAP